MTKEQRENILGKDNKECLRNTSVYTFQLTKCLRLVSQHGFHLDIYHNFCLCVAKFIFNLMYVPCTFVLSRK